MKCSVVIENAVGYSFLCKLITRQCHGCPLVRKCKIFFLQKSAYFSYGGYCVKNLQYQLQTGSNEYLKVKNFVPKHILGI